jgi:hypothetical protein
MALAARADSALVLVGHPTIVVPPQCNPTGESAAKVKLRNGGNSPATLFLTATDVVSKPAGKRLNAKITLTPLASAAGDQPSDQTSIAPGAELWVKVKVTNIDQEGEWETTLQNENADLGPIRIVRNDLPFQLSLDVPTPDAAELTFVQGEPASFRLKNDSLTDYQVTWEYSIDGHTLRPTDLQEECVVGIWCKPGQPVGSTNVPVPHNGMAAVTFQVPSSWFGSWFTGLFKDNAKDGRLLVRRTDGDCPVAISNKIFKIKTHLATSAGASRELQGDFWVFVVLLLGGVCSLVLNFALPNQMRRLKLKAALDALRGQVSDLSNDLASRLRVLVGLGQRLLEDRLKNLTWTNTDFTSEMQSIDQAATRLGTRIQLLDRLGTTRTNFARLCPLTLPPTVVVDMESTFEKIVAIGKKSEVPDTDLQAAQTMIQTLQEQMDSGGKSNAAWVNGLVNRVKDLKLKLDPANGTIGKTTTCKRIRGLLPGPFNYLDLVDPTQIVASDYLVLDRALFKLELVVDYVRQVDPLDAADPFRVRIVQSEPDLLTALKQDSWDKLDAARVLVKQMREGHFREDIKQALQANAVDVKCKRIQIMPFEPCEFTLEFAEDALNNATARDEWSCKWEFLNENEPTLKEEGWEVTHYFQRPETYTLRVTVSNRKDPALSFALDMARMTISSISVQARVRRRLLRVIGVAIAGTFKLNWSEVRKEWHKSRTGASRVLELLWLVLALFLALISMIAGAKDQLLKLDVVPAMIAIFLVGFGADQIKNLLTRRQA